MRVKVKIPKDNVNINIPVPLGLFLNRVTCPIAAHYATKYTEGLIIEGQQLYELIKILKNSKKVFGHYDLVDVETKEGEIIKISI